jgi:hypothetical protein
LDAALTIIAKVGILYNKLERGSQKKLLHEMVDRVVVSPEGTIRRMELLPPFAYLKEVTDRVRNGSSGFERKTKTSAKAGQCSSLLSLGEHSRTQLEHRILSVNTLEFTHIISFPQNDKLKRLSTELAFR